MKGITIDYIYTKDDNQERLFTDIKTDVQTTEKNRKTTNKIMSIQSTDL